MQQIGQPAAKFLPPSDLVIISAVGSPGEFVQEPPGAKSVGDAERAASICRSIAFDQRAQEIEVDVSSHREEGLPISRSGEPTVHRVGIPSRRQQVPDALRSAEATEHVVRDHANPWREAPRSENLPGQPPGS